jgi:hypothetical protein
MQIICKYKFPHIPLLASEQSSEDTEIAAEEHSMP